VALELFKLVLPRGDTWQPGRLHLLKAQQKGALLPNSANVEYMCRMTVCVYICITVYYMRSTNYTSANNAVHVLHVHSDKHYLKLQLLL
jgi:hypothetical protein